MRHRSGRPSGFTLIEAAVVVAIIATLGALAYSSLARLKPRATLGTAAAELQSLIHGARQAALGSGHDVAVLVFPNAAVPGSTGRVIVYEDGNFDFFNGGAVNFATYDPLLPAYGTRSQVVTTLDMPAGIVFGPSTGYGASASLPAPLAGVDVRKACSFCATTGDGRGAIRFDPRGRATFYQGGNVLSVNGGASVSVNSTETGGARTLVITSASGAVRMLGGG